MSYYFPFGRLNTVDSSSFAGLSTTASYAFFANTSSFASKAEYPGAQGDPGMDIVCSCPVGYIACPGLSVPGYALVCLEIAPVCSEGTTIACPPSIPAPTTSTTSTTTTSTTSAPTTTTTSTTGAPTTTTTSTTSTSTTTSTTLACMFEYDVTGPEASSGAACALSEAANYNVHSMGGVEYYTDDTCTTLMPNGYYKVDGQNEWVQFNGGTLAAGPTSCTATTTTTSTTTTGAIGSCYVMTNTSGGVTISVRYTSPTSGVQNISIGPGVTVRVCSNTTPFENTPVVGTLVYYNCGTSCTQNSPTCNTCDFPDPTTTTSTTSTSTTTTTCYSEILYMSDTKATPQLACAGPSIYNYYKTATKLATTNDCGTFAAAGYYSDGVNWYQVTGAGNVSAPTACGTYPTTTSTTTTTTLSGVTGDCYKMTNTTLSTATMNYTSPTFGATTINIPGEQTRYVCSTVYPYQTPPVTIIVDIEECGTTCTVNSNCTGCSAPAPTTTTTTTVAGTTTTTTVGPTTTSTTTTTTLPQCAPGVEYECTVGETTVCCNSAAEPFCCDVGGNPVCSPSEPCPT